MKTKAEIKAWRKNVQENLKMSDDKANNSTNNIEYDEHDRDITKWSIINDVLGSILGES